MSEVDAGKDAGADTDVGTLAGNDLRPTRRVRPRSNPFAYGDHTNSLFGEILDWMLAPLLFLWPISIAATNHVANYIAEQPYDQALANNVTAIAQLVVIDRERVIVNLPTSARKLLHNDEVDTLYYQVTGLKGVLVDGDPEVPKAELPEHIEPNKVLFRDTYIDGENVRIAYSFIPVRPGVSPIVVQVGETLHKREALASRIISGVLLPQFAIIPLAVILVYLGLSRGIAPLSRLRERIQRRRPTDLAPLQIHRIPDEVRPLVDAFNGMMARLEENLQAQQRFIAHAAHQMRTPLTGLKMQAEIALAEHDPQKMRAALRLIDESTDRASHLINQLLLLARAEASHEKIHRVEVVDIDLLACDVTRELFGSALHKNIDIGFESAGRPLMIDGIPLLLHEMLSNLIDNAVKYTPNGGRVTVRALHAEEAVIEVEDDGIGIPEDERPRVFERFYRVLGNEADGSGLGLPIVAEIAELHRSQIVLTAGRDGRGSLFRISFPLHRDDETEAAAELARRKAPNFPVGL
jgi:two-component system sensor histidine kinase TctE